MKKFKTSVLALAMVLGVSGAFISKIHAAPKRDADLYDWTSSSVAPQNPSSTLTGKSIADAEDHFGCNGAGATCADGVDPNGVNPDARIKLN